MKILKVAQAPEPDRVVYETPLTPRLKFGMYSGQGTQQCCSKIDPRSDDGSEGVCIHGIRAPVIYIGLT